MSDKQRIILCLEREHGTYKNYSSELSAQFGDRIKLIHLFTAKDAHDYLSSNRVDLVISCLLQTEINGIDFLNTCKELYPDLPFIIYTTLNYKEEFFSTGFNPDAYVVRNADFSDLLYAVEELLNLKAQK